MKNGPFKQQPVIISFENKIINNGVFQIITLKKSNSNNNNSSNKNINDIN